MMRRNEASSSRGSSRSESVVVDVGRRRNTCGYCKSGRCTSITHGLLAHSLTVYDYQDLLDRGWRRSGCFLYKPEMETTCCPQYTIRLKADDFVPSKEQLRVSRRMQRYLDGTWDGQKQQLVDISDSLQECTHADEQPSSSQTQSLGTKVGQSSKEEELLDNLSEQIDLAMQSLVKSGELPSDIQFPKGVVKKVSQAKKRKLVEGSEDLLYTSNISFQTAAVLRRAKSDGKSVSLPGPDKSSSDVNESDLSPKTIAEKLANELQQLAKINELSLRACNGHINFYSAVNDAAHNGEQHSVALSNRASIRHENEVHDAIPEKMQRAKRQLEICLKRSSFDPEEFALYKRYQMKVHNDEAHKVTESSYRRFLVDTPLIYVSSTGDNTVPPCGFGSFHQQYRVDGQLIAVGVIDILPKCLSSKYLFWDPDLAFLSLGKYSALQEISWVKENEHHCPSLQYYYLGYYIHSCSKMRYKAAYRPSELLCPLRYEWVPYDIAKPLLDRKKYVVLSDFTIVQNGELLSNQDPESLSVSQHDDIGDGDSNDAYVNGDEEMLDPDSESSDDEPFPETNDLATVPTANGDVGNLLLGLRGTRLRYKDLQPALGPADQANLERQLHRYMKVVGLQLAERMVYYLG